jgi:DedD protein
MDRSLKERIIGAVVLVVFAVMVVPVFLDGPSTKTEIITESVSLPGQNGQTRKTQTIVLERDRTEPVPASGNISVADNKPAVIHVKKDQPVAARSLATGPVKSEPKAAGNTKLVQAISPTGMWAVQLGSFSNQANADRLAADLRKQGFAAFLSQLQTESGSLHRVRIGPQKNREGAEAMAAKLNSAGHKGQVVTHP